MRSCGPALRVSSPRRTRVTLDSQSTISPALAWVYLPKTCVSTSRTCPVRLCLRCLLPRPVHHQPTHVRHTPPTPPVPTPVLDRDLALALGRILAREAVVALTPALSRHLRGVEATPHRARGLRLPAVAPRIADLDPGLYHVPRPGEGEHVLKIHVLPAVAHRGLSLRHPAAKPPADAIAVTRGRCLALSHHLVERSHQRAGDGLLRDLSPRLGLDVIKACLVPARPQGARTTREGGVFPARLLVADKNSGGIFAVWLETQESDEDMVFPAADCNKVVLSRYLVGRREMNESNQFSPRVF